MSDDDVIALPLPDEAARVVIREDLDANLLVEAGAGSGKTTELVNRMVALVGTGTATVDEIAAVTFTRKSAGELRERFQAHLESALASEVPSDTERPLLRAALEDLDRAFVGTIHSFCARLLRERPLEVGLDPGFEEIPVEERVSFQHRFWDSFLERAVRDADPALEALSAAGLRPGQLFGLFQKLVENPDVDFPAEKADAPSSREVERIRAELADITATGMELMPARQPHPDWDSLQKKIRTLAFTQEVTGWRKPADFFEALEAITKDGPRGHSITQKRWRDKALAKDFVNRVDAFAVGPDATANEVLGRWYAHRYGLAIAFVKRVVSEFTEHRLRTARLDFQDLLMLTAVLLRGAPDARSDLGLRYRRLLVDEFQDTDPLQAEIMLLLASDPIVPAAPESPAASAIDEGGEGGSHSVDWRTVVPRPGALFVVGDPKQSIYRFRRADILLYEQVKQRFHAFGQVVELTSNFRSRPAVGDLVNEHFAAPHLFPEEASAEQARFEPLNTRPRGDTAPAEGVFWYPLDPASGSRGAVTDDDAARLATWIRARMDAGTRRPGDFLILTRTRHFLSTYARELEARGVPVQVTGAGIGVEEELLELMALLECLIDPGDPVKVVSVLVGLFFGLDLDTLTTHRLAGGSLDVDRPGDRGDETVLEALRVLHRWWRAATVEPADIVVGRLVAELGLLPFAAAGELGSLRAGALAYAMDIVRAATVAGDASLPGVLEAFTSALDLSEAEAPLEPGREDVVRLMNLHQAKGLEAAVVVLADPSKSPSGSVDIHIERDADGNAVGHLLVTERGSKYAGNRILARPLDWLEKEAVEARFAAAEDVRLLYVAATRARDELVVARWPDKADKSPWQMLDPWIVPHANALVLGVEDPSPREVLDLGPAEAARRASEAQARLEEAGVPSYRHVTVTDVAKGGTHADDAGASRTTPTAAPGPRGAARFKGYSWGSVVHDALAAAADEPDVTVLRAVCRDLLVEYQRPLDDHGEPVELDELVGLVQGVRGSELWRRAEVAERRLIEVPFAAPGATRPLGATPTEVAVNTEPTQARRQLDLFGAPDPRASSAPRGGADDDTEDGGTRPEDGQEPLPSVLEGVVDLAFKEEDGWVIADYKTDVGTDPEFEARRISYRRQVDLYAEAWTRLTGEPVKERVLFFTTRGAVESW